jgi:hypothetical protein
MVLEFQRAERVGDALDRVGLAVGEVVARIDAPRRAGARMARVQNAVEHRIAQIDVAEAMSILARSTRAPFGNSPAACGGTGRGFPRRSARGTGCCARLGQRAALARISSCDWSST